ncbi:unnamed protein product [Hyaloperonospora brassicae]|uniref:Casein kinase I n=1 Tax=Hyaloperonospora brassicae TaxID=162125 RepID=A0AAV0UEY0_HYABA|nr:unnamed protein product [Hyaloperonospora brassicae]
MMRAASSPLEPLNKNILLAGEVIAEKWKIGEKIGEGTFSQIYSAYSIGSRDKVAVKVEAPSALKPVLEWESLILKSLQDCPYVCRYFYHGKHGDSTVLVMELLGDSMSMLRMSPDSIHGVPLAKSVSVGLEMLDCIEAFHRHGYVHRDIKASNFALSAADRHLLKQQRYYIIDFGLSRQHIGEDRQVLPARPVAEFRGTSMYASLSSHRRQELGPKDDLWSWFYLVMDFLRGELPWATDAQQKNRQTVLSLKEHYTELNPRLLVEGLPGATQLLEMMVYLQSLKYEDLPDYARIRKQLQAVKDSSLVLDNSDSGEEANANKKDNHMLVSASEIDWDAFESERERALTWTRKADELKNGDGAPHTLLAIAKRYKTFFDSDGLSFDEQVRVQSAVYHIEKKLRTRSNFLAPPPIQSFVKRRQSEQKMRSDALRKRREKDLVVRQALEIKNDERTGLATSTQGSRKEWPGGASGEGSAEMQNGKRPDWVPPVKPKSFTEVSDSKDVRTRRCGTFVEAAVSAPNPRGSPLDERQHMDTRPIPRHQPPHTMPLTSPTSRWDRTPNHGGAVPAPVPPPEMSSSSLRPDGTGHLSASPPAKHYRRRSPEPIHPESSRRRSSHHRSYSNDRPREYVHDDPEQYTKGYPKEYVNDYPKEHVKIYTKEYMADHPKEYAKGPSTKYVGYPKERVKVYAKEHVKNYPEEYATDYQETYPAKKYPTEHAKDYRYRSPSPDGRHSYAPQPQYRHSPSQHRQSYSRDDSRNDGSWDVDARSKPSSAPDKHRRSTRWQPRP